MKTSRTALAALLALSGTAFAQSSVTLYGRFDSGLVVDSGNAAGKSVRISSGVAKGSLLGFKGTEDLGDGAVGRRGLGRACDRRRLRAQGALSSRSCGHALAPGMALPPDGPRGLDVSVVKVVSMQVRGVRDAV